MATNEFCLNAKEFRDVMKAVTSARGKDPTRQNLTNVSFIVNEHGTLKVACTDGYRVHVASRQTAYGPGRWTLDASRLPFLMLELNATIKAKSNAYTFTLTEEKDEFPDYHRVIPPPVAADLWETNGQAIPEEGMRSTGVGTFSGSYMADACEAAALFRSSKCVRIEIGADGREDPLTVRAEGDTWEFVATVMPMRDSKDAIR